MTITYFRAYPATVSIKFTCACCGAPNRTKKITVECTLNPFNTEATTPAEVRAQSLRKAKAEAVEFMTEPWCKKCSADLNWDGREALRDRRKSALSASCQ